MQWIDDSCWYRARISLVQEKNTYEVDLQESDIISLIISAFLLLPCASPVQGITEAFLSPHVRRQLCSQVFRLVWAVNCTWLMDEWCWGKGSSVNSVFSKSFWGGLNILKSVLGRQLCSSNAQLHIMWFFTTQLDIMWLSFTVFDKNVKTALWGAP